MVDGPFFSLEFSLADRVPAGRAGRDLRQPRARWSSTRCSIRPSSSTAAAPTRGHADRLDPVRHRRLEGRVDPRHRPRLRRRGAHRPRPGRHRAAVDVRGQPRRARVRVRRRRRAPDRRPATRCGHRGRRGQLTSIALALGAALGWGIADFVGGTTSRASSALVVLWSSQWVGFAIVLVAAAIVGLDSPTGSDLLFAAAAGATMTLGLGALYGAMAVGAMSIAAPIAATGVAIPVAVGLASGDDPERPAGGRPGRGGRRRDPLLAGPGVPRGADGPRSPRASGSRCSRRSAAASPRPRSRKPRRPGSCGCC